MKMGAPLSVQRLGMAHVFRKAQRLSGYAEIFQRNIHGFGCHPTDFRYFRSVCRRCGLLSRPDGLHADDGRYILHVPHRTAVVKTVTGEDVSQEDLGGASVHASKSGVTHFTAETGEEGLAIIRKLLSFIPQNNLEEAPLVNCTDPIDRMDDLLNEIIPDSPNKPYDMYEVIGAIIDN